MQQNKSVKQLSLDDFQLFGLEEMSKNSTLTSLVLKDLDIDKEGAVALKQILIKNSSLRELTLYNCIKSVEVADVVAEGFQHNAGVMNLILKNIKGADVIGKLIHRLQKNSTLTSLVLEYIYINEEGASTLKQILFENTTLRELTLSHCTMDDETANEIAEGLHCSTGLLN